MLSLTFLLVRLAETEAAVEEEEQYTVVNLRTGAIMHLPARSVGQKLQLLMAQVAASAMRARGCEPRD
jgi:hypothetical protein